MSNPQVKITTNHGEIVLELFAEKAPITVKNFLTYVNEGFYNKTLFHRVIPKFMIQGGGFNLDFEQKPTHAQIENEANNGEKNLRGTIAMARTQVVNSATSQFFINTVNNDFLDFKAPNMYEFGYCVFGKVIEGMETVDKISAVATSNYHGHADVPVTQVVIEKAELV